MAAATTRYQYAQAADNSRRVRITAWNAPSWVSMLPLDCDPARHLLRGDCTPARPLDGGGPGSLHACLAPG